MPAPMQTKYHRHYQDRSYVFLFAPPLYHWRLPSLPSCRGDDVMQTPVPLFDAQVIRVAAETCAPAAGPRSAPVHLLCPFACVSLLSFFLVRDRLYFDKIATLYEAVRHFMSSFSVCAFICFRLPPRLASPTRSPTSVCRRCQLVTHQTCSTLRPLAGNGLLSSLLDAFEQYVWIPRAGSRALAEGEIPCSWCSMF